MFQDFSRLRGRTVAFVGNGKNAGKTTALCALLRAIDADGTLTPALTSIGRDGEKTDLVTGTEKPTVFVREGTLCATTTGLMRQCDFTKEILRSTGFDTPLGEVLLLRARSGGYVQPAGPSVVRQAAEVNRALLSLGADCVLMDGAASRRSQGAASAADYAVLCVGACYDADWERTVEHGAYLAELMELPIENEDGCEALPGAVTDNTARKLLERGRELEGKTLLADDPAALLLGPESYRRLCRAGARFAVRRRSELLYVTTNPFSARGCGYDAEQFRAAMQQRVRVPVYDVMGERR